MIAGAVEGLATVPPSPLAVTTLAVVTVPPLVVGVYFTQTVCVESDTIIYQSVQAVSLFHFPPSYTRMSHFETPLFCI